MKKILAIDDDKIFLKILRDAAERVPNNEFSVSTANDGMVGLNSVEEEQPDLIILDMRMPNMDGIEFLKELKRRGYGIPVVISSNLSDVEKISEGIELGVKGYVVKSDYSLDGLLEEVQRILSEEDAEAV